MKQENKYDDILDAREVLLDSLAKFDLCPNVRKVFIQSIRALDHAINEIREMGDFISRS